MAEIKKEEPWWPCTQHDSTPQPDSNSLANNVLTLQAVSQSLTNSQLPPIRGCRTMEASYPPITYNYGLAGVPDALFTNQNIGKHVSALWRTASVTGNLPGAPYAGANHSIYNNWVVPTTNGSVVNPIPNNVNVSVAANNIVVPSTTTSNEVRNQQAQQQQQQQQAQQQAQQQQQQQQAQTQQSQQQTKQTKNQNTNSNNNNAANNNGTGNNVASTNTDISGANGNNASDTKWVVSKQRFSWDNSPVASYNHVTKMFRCVACNTVGFSLRIAEHYLGTHANAKVFQCPNCPYSSSWSRCVRMHMGKHHGMHHVPDSLWKGQPLLDEILQLLHNLKASVETMQRDQNGDMFESIEKRYMCPKCPYATDRRDLYARHENIHKEEKPFHCYVCLKVFNRADHVKKHFYRIHKDQRYDISLIRRFPTKNGSSSLGTNASTTGNNSTPTGNSGLVTSGNASAVATAVPLNGFPWCAAANNVNVNGIVHAPVLPTANGKGSRTNNNNTNNQIMVKPDPDGKPPKKKPPKTFLCNYCPWRGVDSWCLRRHLNTHIKPFPCPLCEYKAARAERLCTHILKVHSKFACSKCSFVTDNESTLEQHVKEKHYSNGVKLLSCSVCSESFEVRSDLETHNILAHNQRLVECGLSRCDFRTADIAILEQHQREKHAFSTSAVAAAVAVAAAGAAVAGGESYRALTAAATQTHG